MTRLTSTLKPFVWIVEVDQKLHPCIFFSRRLSPVERNYNVGNCELPAPVLALQVWRHWLEGTAQLFVVWTDHKNLAYLQSVRRFNSHQAHWTLFLGRFNFALAYRLVLVFADQSDPDPCPILPPSCSVGAATWQVEEHEALCSASDLGGAPPNTLFVPDSAHSKVLYWGHSSKLACHPGLNRTLHLLRQRLWWPSMFRNARAFVATCPVCSHGKSFHQPSAGLPAANLAASVVTHCHGFHDWPSTL